jgi:acetylornithine deacetylase/succinyl-diaminopimelate desuccinylase-like protein
MKRACSAATVTAATALLCAAVAAQTIPAGADRALSREIFREIVEIRSTEAEGTAHVARVLADRLTAAGFPKEDVHVLGADRNTQNLVVRFRGRNPQVRAVLLMAHLDVVPARRSSATVGSMAVEPSTTKPAPRCSLPTSFT